MTTVTYTVDDPRWLDWGSDAAPTIVGGTDALADADDATYVEVADTGTDPYTDVLVDLVGPTIPDGATIIQVTVRCRCELLSGSTGNTYFEVAVDVADTGDPFYADATGEILSPTGTPGAEVFPLETVPDDPTLVAPFGDGTVQLCLVPNFDGDGVRFYEVEVDVEYVVDEPPDPDQDDVEQTVWVDLEDGADVPADITGDVDPSSLWPGATP